MTKSSFILHIRPRQLPSAALRFTQTWGLGGAAALIIFIQFITGLLLHFNYKPVPVEAYLSVQRIQSELFSGQLLRNLHHWTGHLLVIIVGLHLIRVFFNNAFYGPRKWNWFIGLGLGFLTLAANFSGYLLPWDQLSYWAVTIATSLLEYIPLLGEFLQGIVRGGENVGAPTLQLFYSIHTIVIPLFLCILMTWHFWYVRKAGGVLTAKESNLPENDGNSSKMVKANPHLFIRELAFAAILIALLLLFSMFVNAPLGNMANPDLTPQTVKAPWYFIGGQELLLHIDPIIAVCVLPLALIIFLFALPYWGKKLIGKDEWKTPLWVRIITIGGSFALLILTITGMWFRGPGMKLVSPW